MIHTQGLHTLGLFFCLFTSCIRLSVCLEGVPFTQPRCHWGPVTHSFTCTLLVCYSCEDFFSLQKNQNDKKAVMVSLFRVISLSARVCVRGYSRILAIALRVFRSPVVRLVGFLVWLMHVAIEMASSIWSARKEYSPQGSSQAQRQTQKQFLQDEQYSQLGNHKF